MKDYTKNFLIQLAIYVPIAVLLALFLMACGDSTEVRDDEGKVVCIVRTGNIAMSKDVMCNNGEEVTVVLDPEDKTPTYYEGTFCNRPVISFGRDKKYIVVETFIVPIADHWTAVSPDCAIKTKNGEIITNE